MSLPAGTRLGQYEVVSPLGHGGMGEVYRARDTKLGRDVALKVLPDLLAGDPDRLARFRREAQVLASLNHPNIAHLYGFEESPTGATGDTWHALVMELVEGPTLADRIGAGAIPWREAIPIARQIADALETAHDQGIIHRDLKPANVKVRDDGTVKVLDFGLAKAVAPDDAARSGGASNSPTLTARATQLGMILGTAAYMAPEQARGRAVDRRADVWAFGVVLYEMLTGRRAFDGDDISITLASVLKEDVDWNAVPADVPHPIRRLVRRCLEKDPKKRLSAIGDARFELDEALDPTASGAAVASAPNAGAAAAPHRWRDRAGWIVAGVATLGLAGALAALWWPRAPEPSAPRVVFSIASDVVSVATAQSPSLSPDGRLLAYLGPSQSGGANVVWIRPLDSTEGRPLTGTESAQYLFWSPDSQWLAFAAGGEIRKVNAAGGVPQKVCEFTSFTGGTWLPDQRLLLSTNNGSGGRLHIVNAQGGLPAEVARDASDGPGASITWPFALPDGRHFIYLGWSVVLGERELFAQSIDGGAPVRLVQSDASGVYASGHLLFVRSGTLFAQRFDPERLTLSGEPVQVADEVAFNRISGRAAVTVSTNGVLSYRQTGASAAAAELAWFSRNGKPLGTVGDARNYYQIRLSPDEKRVAISEVDAGAQSFRLSVLDLSNGVSSTVTDEKSLANDPVWLPDSQTIAYEAIRQGIRQFFTHRVGSAEPRLIFESPDDPKWLDDVSADGKFMLFHRPRPSKLYAVPLEGERQARMLIDTPQTIDSAHFSPDGRWIAYQITENTTYQVWVASFPAFDQRRRVSPAGGGLPFWRGDGRELFYLTPNGKLMSVRVTPNGAGTSLEFATPVELFQSPWPAPALTVDLYSPTKDGQRFLFIRPRDVVTARTPITVVVNWK